MRSIQEQHRDLIAELFRPEGSIATFEEIGDGWDSYTYRVNGDWVFQVPRPSAPQGAFRRQVGMLRALKGKLPAAIPQPELVSEAPLCMGYRWIEGVRAAGAPDGDWPEQLGVFLRALHGVGTEGGGLAIGGWRESYAEVIQDLRKRVAPLLDAEEQRGAERLFGAFLDEGTWAGFAPVLVHRDLGPDHVLVAANGELAGVIDWGDAGLGDAAVDFAWLLNGSPAEGERALMAYGGGDEAFSQRARLYHQLGPWYEVRYGLTTGQPDFVASGLSGVRARLWL